MHRYSKDMLKKLRNDIPIARLIKDLLMMPCKVSDGYFRFLCPLCSEFHTATHPKTNLARCFRCKVNFNAIDLVMTVKCLNFKEAVNYLQDFIPG